MAWRSLAGAASIVPLMPGDGRRFTAETAREAGLRSAEARRRRAEEGESGRPAISRAVEQQSLDVLTKQLESPDERIAQAAATKLLEYSRGRPATAQEEPRETRIVFETVFAPPRHLVDAFDPDKLKPPPGIDE